MHVNALIYLSFSIQRSTPKVEPHGPAVKACPLEAKNGPTKIIADCRSRCRSRAAPGTLRKGALESGDRYGGNEQVRDIAVSSQHRRSASRSAFEPGAVLQTSARDHRRSAPWSFGEAGHSFVLGVGRLRGRVHASLASNPWYPRAGVVRRRHGRTAPTGRFRSARCQGANISSGQHQPSDHVTHQAATLEDRNQWLRAGSFCCNCKAMD